MFKGDISKLLAAFMEKFNFCFSFVPWACRHKWVGYPKTFVLKFWRFKACLWVYFPIRWLVALEYHPGQFYAIFFLFNLGAVHSDLFQYLDRNLFQFCSSCLIERGFYVFPFWPFRLISRFGRFNFRGLRLSWLWCRKLSLALTFFWGFFQTL